MRRRTNWQSTDNDAENEIVPFEILYVVIMLWVGYVMDKVKA